MGATWKEILADSLKTATNDWLELGMWVLVWYIDHKSDG